MFVLEEQIDYHDSSPWLASNGLLDLFELVRNVLNGLSYRFKQNVLFSNVGNTKCIVFDGDSFTNFKHRPMLRDI